MPALKLSGIVFSGTGEGRNFIALPWVTKQLIQKTGFSPFLGTLNIKLDSRSIKQRCKLKKMESTEIEPQTGYFKGILFKAKLNWETCFIVIPKVPNYPLDVLEIISAINLREKLGLKDGDKVTLEVTA